MKAADTNRGWIRELLTAKTREEKMAVVKKYSDLKLDGDHILMESKNPRMSGKGFQWIDTTHKVSGD